MDVSVTMPQTAFGSGSLANLGIRELEGKSLEAKSRDEVNIMLQNGWILLHIYTLRYKEDDTWRERPMAILGKPEQI